MGFPKELTMATKYFPTPSLPFTSHQQLISAAVGDPWQRLIHLCLETAAWGSMCFLGQLEREKTGSTYSCSKDPDFHQLKGNADVQQPLVSMSATQETQSELQFNSYT